MVALVTPMTSDGAIDYSSLKMLVDWHVSEGTQAIVAVGTTGESATLDVDEHIDVISRVVEYAAGRVPVIAGAGANSTAEAVELTQHAQSSGASAALLVTPYYNKPPQEGLYQHYRTIAEAVSIPQILYNVPGRTACDLLPETVARLAQIDNIVGLKEATGDLQRIDALKACCPEGFELYSGDDPTACEAILKGCTGDISVTANVAPAKMQAMCEAAARGDADKARVLDAELRPLHDVLFIEPNPIPAKWALHRMGRIEQGIRLPLVEMSQDGKAQLETVLQSTGLV